MSNLTQLDETFQRRQKTAELLSEWSVRLNGQAAEWDIETVKHLVVLNAAGVAGSTTLLASADGSDPKRLLIIVLALFGVGVILAVLNLHLAARSFDMMSEEIKDRMHELLEDLNSPLDQTSLLCPREVRSSIALR